MWSVALAWQLRQHDLPGYEKRLTMQGHIMELSGERINSFNYMTLYLKGLRITSGVCIASQVMKKNTEFLLGTLVLK